MSKYAPLVLYVGTLVTALFLAVGSFMGFPNDPTLCGMFWLMTALYMVLPMLDSDN